MLLEAPNSNSSLKNMSPSLEAAFTNGSKIKSSKMTEHGHSRNDFLSPKMSMIDVHEMPSHWSKISQEPLHGNFLSKTMPSGNVPGMMIPGDMRFLPERPAPIYPAMFKRDPMMSPNSMDNPKNQVIPEMQKTNFAKQRQAANSMINPEPRLLRPELHPSPMQMQLPATSVANQSSQRHFPFYTNDFAPRGMPGTYPNQRGPSVLNVPHSQHQMLHVRPSHQRVAPGTPSLIPGTSIAANTAGFMSLANILFQPKYPIGKKTFQCQECRYITDRKNNLKRHIATMHQDCGKFLECCDTVFRSKAALRDHVMLYHRTGYKCRFCGRNFCRKALLKRHLAVHNGQKQYICEVCDYATSHKSNLERHRKIHGFGSPLGSDDGEEFIRDGPDADNYDMMHYKFSQDQTSRQNDTKIDKNEEEDQDVDVESSNLSSDDDIFINESNPFRSTDSDMPIEHEKKKYGADYECEIIRNDPLLQAFPINLSINKNNNDKNKKYKSRFYLPDRLRQTYEEPNPVGTDKSPKKTDNTPVHESQSPILLAEESDAQRAFGAREIADKKSQDIADLEIANHREASPCCRADSKGSPEHSPRQRPSEKAFLPRGSPSATTRLNFASGKNEFKGNVVVKDSSVDFSSSDNSGGSRRLYASPYKCSGCGIGLSSQQKLNQHLSQCRKVDLMEPTRPIHAIALGQFDSCVSIKRAGNPSINEQENYAINYSNDNDTILTKHKRKSESDFDKNDDLRIDYNIQRENERGLEDGNVQNIAKTYKNDIRGEKESKHVYINSEKYEEEHKKYQRLAKCNPKAMEGEEHDRRFHQEAIFQGQSQSRKNAAKLTGFAKQTDYKEDFKMEHAFNEKPVDYSVRNLLRDTFEEKGGEGDTFPAKTEGLTGTDERRDRGSLSSSPTDAGLSLPIKKRCISH